MDGRELGLDEEAHLGSQVLAADSLSNQDLIDAIDWNVSIPETFPLPETQCSDYSVPAGNLTNKDIIPETFPLPETLDRTSNYQKNHAETLHTRSSSPINLKEKRESGNVNIPFFTTGNTNFPSNDTLRNGNNENTILFKQLNISTDINSTSTEATQSKLMSRDPISIAKCFSELIREEDIEDVRINRRRNIIAVQLANPSSDNFLKLLNLKKIFQYEVKGYKPSEENLGIHCTGVIGPISLDEDLDEVKNMIRSSSEIN